MVNSLSSRTVSQGDLQALERKLYQLGQVLGYIWSPSIQVWSKS